MKISLGCDHGGFNYKEEIKKYLIEHNYEVIDEGTNSLDSCNYAEYAIKAAEDVASGKANFGILVCSSGEGVTIAANKVKGVRCGIGYNDKVSELLRVHNNANMIAFGALYMDLKDVIKRVDIFLNSDFEGGRHQKRVDTIISYEK